MSTQTFYMNNGRHAGTGMLCSRMKQRQFSARVVRHREDVAKVSHATPVKMLACRPGAVPGMQFCIRDAIWGKACANEHLKGVVYR
eukprot:358126-Chlamydomonas_euryale.AAC.2